jgi:hypothetical protein
VFLIESLRSVLVLIFSIKAVILSFVLMLKFFVFSILSVFSKLQFGIWAFGQCSKKLPLVPSKVSIFGFFLVCKNSGILAFCQCGQKLAFWHLAL